jgi:hypothetical protein
MYYLTPFSDTSIVVSAKIDELENFNVRGAEI